jgi:hypothetical protein
LRRARTLTALLALGLLPACRSAAPGGTPSAETPAEAPEPLPVRKVGVEIVVAAWAEPSRLPYGGGETQILVRVQRRGGEPLARVEVRLTTSDGTLFSNGRVLTTDARGMTRDRLTTRRTASVVLNAGGTRYRFLVSVAAKPR